MSEAVSMAKAKDKEMLVELVTWTWNKRPEAISHVTNLALRRGVKYKETVFLSWFLMTKLYRVLIVGPENELNIISDALCATYPELFDGVEDHLDT